MPESSPPWMRHIVYRSERTRTTWTLRLGLLMLATCTLWSTSGWWTGAIGRSLVCHSERQRSDAILIENFDPDYRLFESARNLRAAGMAPRVLVPIRKEAGEALNAVAVGIAEVMARISRLGAVEFIPIREVEPISLNAGRDIRRFLGEHRVRSVIVVTPVFRSRRSQLVYNATLTAAGITVSCEPVGDAQAAHDMDAHLAWSPGRRRAVAQAAVLSPPRTSVPHAARRGCQTFPLLSAALAAPGVGDS